MYKQAFLYRETLKNVTLLLEELLCIGEWERKERSGQCISVTSGGGMPEVLAYEFFLKRISPTAVKHDTG